MKLQNGWAIAAATLLITACGANFPKEGMTLQWSPRDTLDAMSIDGIDNVAVQFGTFTDAREQPSLVGVNREVASTPRDAFTHDDVGKFVGTNMRTVFLNSGLKTVDASGDVVITGTVRQFFVTETNTYQGVVVLQVVMLGRNGKTLWQGTTAGNAQHFGKSYSVENYNETLSDAVLDATSKLLKNEAFRQALGHAHPAH